MKPYSDIPYSHNSLKTFESVARHLSFTLAANELNVTQSAVSRQVKQLEEGLAVSLIIRKHRSIELTNQGVELLAVLQRNYQSLQALIESWQPDKQKRIVIKAALSFATRSLLPKIQQLQERYPEHEIVVIPTIDEDSVLNSGDYDLLILTSRFPQQYKNRPDVQFLRDEYMAPVCSQELYANGSDFQSLLSLPRLHPTLDHHDWKTWLSTVGHKDNYKVRNTTFFTLDLALSACLSSQGMTVTDLLLILPELEHGYLVCPDQAQIHPSAWQYFCHCRGSSPIVEEINQWIQTETKKELDTLKRLSLDFKWSILETKRI
ncbi:LysR family transcriptional regulator [Vibrio sp. UCD-FRSSP16_10]|uniref:LysR family transcriptional regulator n=1 Tax=unclassified Vibrio TaxID=2614977 RepID=UPI0007FED9F3|nr:MULTISPECIES: LysR family transcriptional regulator [unclassified Vibrio]OBT08569.1 LysR family transcriptional regulator [Vibrio sp. UCD-FRSSP16_30]OBT18099.1 LysR family transcriptional regulator [Vibrio sp. UCD-FRSSP16_10]